MKNAINVTLFCMLFLLLGASTNATIADTQQVKERIPIKNYTKSISLHRPFFRIFPPGLSDTEIEERSEWNKEITTGKEEKIGKTNRTINGTKFEFARSAIAVWLPLISLLVASLLMQESRTKFFLTFVLPISYCGFYFFLGPNPIILALYFIAYSIFAFSNKKLAYWVFVGLPFVFPVYAQSAYLYESDPTGIAYFAGYCFVLACLGTFVHLRFAPKAQPNMKLIF